MELLAQEQDYLIRESEGFVLENGEVLPEVNIRYETYGDFKNGNAPVIWICCPLTTDAHVAGYSRENDPKSVGWWNSIIGSRKPINTDEFFVVCSNNLGGCRGTTGPSSVNPKTGKSYGSSFPEITISDMVKVQKKLADFLGVKKLFAVIGGSMGGFQALVWAIEYPDFVDRCAVIASGTKLSAQALGFEIVARSIILDDENFQNGDYGEDSKPAKGLANARKLAHITYLSAESMQKRFTEENLPKKAKRFFSGSSLESYLEYQGNKFVSRFDANSYLHITGATDNFNLETKYGSLENAVSRIKANVLNVLLSSDWLFPPSKSYELTLALLNQKKIVSSVEIDTSLGHDGFLLETESLGALLSKFLDTRAVEDRSEHYEEQTLSATLDMDRISKFIPEKSKVLDIGCGNGRLLHSLWRQKQITGTGIDRAFEGILNCLSFDVPVLQRDLDKNGLAGIADSSFDFVIFNRTLQEVQDARETLLEILRIGKKAIITFPNFGNYAIRNAILFTGHMPKSVLLHHEWYNTPNIHLFTLADFKTLCHKEGIRIEALEFVNSKCLSKLFTRVGFTNLGAEQVIAVVSKD